MDWIALWENGVLRLAAACVAAGIVWRYLVTPLFHAARSTLRGWRDLRERVRAAAVIIQRELTPNGGASVKDHVTGLAARVAKLEGGQHDLAALQTTAMAQREAETAFLIKQLREQGVTVEPLPDARINEHREKGSP